jgi:hypothetical protein
MKMRLIDADALKEAVNNKKVVGRFNTIQLIDNAPTVFDDKAYSDGYTQGTCDCEHAHERPQGEWLIECGNTFHFSCSQCGCAGSQWDKFCRHCGAKMQKGGAV